MLMRKFFTIKKEKEKEKNGDSSGSSAVGSSAYPLSGRTEPTSNSNAIAVSAIDEAMDLTRMICTVAIVDDSPLNRKYLRRVLLSLCPQLVVLEFEDGKPAVQFIEGVLSRSPLADNTIVFMDNIMNELHGPDAAKQMRQLGFTGKIVAVTGTY
jgi:CheY-like chemotaxis protein